MHAFEMACEEHIGAMPMLDSNIQTGSEPHYMSEVNIKSLSDYCIVANRTFSTIARNLNDQLLYVKYILTHNAICGGDTLTGMDIFAVVSVFIYRIILNKQLRRAATEIPDIQFSRFVSNLQNGSHMVNYNNLM